MNESLKLDGFTWEIELVDLATGEVIEREVQHNRIPREGLDFLIQAPFGAVAPVGSFYCGLFRANYLPVDGTKAADIPGTLQEFTDYAEPTRPLWERAYNGSGTQDNFASKAVFTPTADAMVYGAFLVAAPAKGSTAGPLISVVRFNTVKPLTAGIEARLATGITYTPTNVV